MKWNLPPKIKIYEALGSLGDNRLEVDGNNGRLFSSSGNKFYDISWEPSSSSIMTNDNASFFIGYLGYPAIAFLMKRQVIKYDKKWTKALKGIKWKDINKRFNNNFNKTLSYILDLISKRGYNIAELEREVDKIYHQIENLRLNLLDKKKKPPRGY